MVVVHHYLVQQDGEEHDARRRLEPSDGQRVDAEDVLDLLEEGLTDLLLHEYSSRPSSDS